MNYTKQQKKQVNSASNQNKIIEKVISDLEDLSKKLNDQFQINENEQITNDSYELQKFCSKLEFLLQNKLKDKKSLLSSSTNSNKDYWNVFVNLLNHSRAFEDAIKYVKNLNEIKTNIGRGRAFIRFCLQYHRLADAIQQFSFDDKILCNWYTETSVWLNIEQKSKIIQILYDLNDINFDIITKSNYELDTSWPTIITSNQQNNISLNRTRTLSVNSVSSAYTDNADLLSSTPLEMDDDIFNKILNKNINENDDLNYNIQKKISPTSFHSNSGLVCGGISETIIENNNEDIINNHEFEMYDKKLKEYELKLTELEIDLNLTKNENKELIEIKNENKCLLEEINNLNKKINEIELINKNNNNNNNAIEIEIEEKSIYDTDYKNNIYLDELNEYRNKYSQMDINYKKSIEELKIYKDENDALKKEISSLKFELSSKVLNEENLIKDAVSQTNSLNTLKDMCLQQEITINRLKDNLDLIKNKRQVEIDVQLNEIQNLKHALESEENENILLNDQIIKLTKSLEEEKKMNKNLTHDLIELKKSNEKENQYQKQIISQLEMDNNEIKKRLVKLIKEKAELWQKADNLEYENLLKSTAMWQDDANIHNCMSCNSQFNFLLRKHHCRICLKIYCYYCCNNWIEYNNSKVRVCKQCHESQENLFRIKSNTIDIQDNHSSKDINHNIIVNNSDSKKDDDMDDEEDDDPDINFEVRSEKLSCHDDDKSVISNNNTNNNNNNNNASSLDTSSSHLESKRGKDVEYFIPDNAFDDLDTFAIVSNDEIARVLNDED